jgi:hypothetical protein
LLLRPGSSAKSKKTFLSAQSATETYIQAAIEPCEGCAGKNGGLAVTDDPHRLRGTARPGSMAGLD